MTDLATFAQRMRKRADDLPGKVARLAADTADAVVHSLVAAPPIGTPVDTSQAESNWQVGLGSPVTTLLAPHVAGFAGSTQAASAGIVTALAGEILAGKKPGQTIYISNGVPYIRRLNYEGHSAQSDNFVQRAADAGRQYLKDARARLFKD